MHKLFLLLSFSSCLFGMHQETDSDFVKRTQQAVRNGERYNFAMSEDGQKLASVGYEVACQKDVLRCDDVINKVVIGESRLSKTGPHLRAFFVDFNKQSDKLIVFYLVDKYDIIDVSKMESDI